MPARKKATSTGKKASAKKSARTRAGARVETGAVPPYGDPIRGAIARGDVREMKDLAASTRKWLADVQSALNKLESALKKAEKK